MVMSPTEESGQNVAETPQDGERARVLEMRLARALLRALRRNDPMAYITRGRGNDYYVDGTFDVLKVARELLRSDAGQSP